MAVLSRTPLTRDGVADLGDLVGAITSGRRRRRARVVGVTGVLALLLTGLFCLALSIGDMNVPLVDVVRSLAGAGDPATDFVIRELRLPRALVAVMTGGAFGLSGVVFQTLLRNPLASPDLIGISFGASAAAVFAIVVLGVGGVVVSGVAFGGALVAALAIYALAWNGGVSGYRFVLVGIALGAMFTSVTSWVLTRADLYSANEAFVWLTGSVNSATWGDAGVLGACLVVLVPVTLLLGRYLRLLSLGDDAATALGAPVERARLLLVLVAVALAAVATAAVGPVGFVALVCGPIAKRLVRNDGSALVAAMVVGGIVMLGSDLVAQHAMGEAQMPVGVVTGLVGAPYLIWLLVTTNRVGRGG